MPNTKWLQYPKLSPWVEATLSKDVVNQDQKFFRCQEMWLEVATADSNSRNGVPGVSNRLN